MSALFVGVRIAVLLSQTALAKLRRPTSVASVAMKGGRRTTVISHACNVPTKKPVKRLARTATSTTTEPTGLNAIISAGANASMVTEQTVPDNAIMEPLERSMPPAMMTTAAPSEKIPSIALLRAISRRLSTGRNK